MISINLIKKDDISKREALFAYLNLNHNNIGPAAFII